MIHLHTHTMYSLRDSIIRIDELIEYLKKLGQNSIAITEHGRNLGSVAIYKQMNKAGIKYIHGCEMYMCDDVTIKDKDSRYYHLILLCKNEVGRLNLNTLMSISEQPENFYYKPRIDFSILEKYSEGLICLSACMAGEISRFLEKDNKEQAIVRALKYKELFQDDYYLEIQAHSEPLQISQNKKIVALAKELNIETVVTCDAHYIKKEDKNYQNKYAFNGSYKEDGEIYVDCFIQSEEEVIERIKYLDLDTITQSVKNTHIISDKCNVKIPLSPPIMPHLEVPKEFKDSTEWLIHVCKSGFAQKLNIDYDKKELYDKTKMLTRYVYNEDGDLERTEQYQLSQSQILEYIGRFDYEINSLHRMGFIDYILLVHSYANIAKRRGVARGSGGGSLVCYVSNITNIDPIEHKLYFERFIDVGALELLETGKITKNELKIPDIDLDFSSDSCVEVLDFLVKKYGEDKVASIGMFGTNKTKGTIRDMCKVFNISLEQEDEIAKSFGEYELEEIDMMISGKIPLIESAKEAVANVRAHKELFDYVRKLIGLPKSFGLHPCFTKGHKVKVVNGYKNIEDIKIGDLVYTHKGNLKKVVRCSFKESDDLYNIKVTGSKLLEATGNHPFYCRKRIETINKKRNYDVPTWTNTKDLNAGDLIGIYVNNNSIINVPDTNLPTHLEDFWWIAGRFVGDGWTTNIKGRKECRTEICCNKNNREIKDIEERFLKLNIPYRITEKETSINLISQSKDLNKFFVQFGKYAHGKKIPDFVINLPENYLKIFLDGYFSADGSINKKGYQTFKTVSLDLALGLQQCIYKVYKTSVSMSVIPACTEKIQGRIVQSKEKYNLCFKKYTTKRDRSFYSDGYLWTPVKKINKTEKKNIVYNITVLDDSSYVVENLCVHNCGRIISTKELDFFTPSCYDSSGVRFLQGDMYGVEDLGLVKIDVLGLRTIDQEYDTLEMSGENADFIDSKQDFSDNKVLDIFRNGDTVGVFQMSSYGMKNTLKKMNVQGIEDLSIANALYRPGAMAYIDNFCRRRKGEESFNYLHPDLEPILKSTYGIMVFQEQLIEIGRLAKIRNPDKLRKATGKKDVDLLNEVKPELELNLKNRGWTQEQFDKLWLDMIEFSKYSFNKSHSSAYGIIAYMTAKQKAYYPKEFYAGLLNSYLKKSSFVKDTANEIVEDMSKHNILFNRLDFRTDHRKCSVDKRGINYAIGLIKECNTTIAENLYSMSKNQYGTFVDILLDIYKNKVLNKAQLSTLIKLDYFSEFGNIRELLSILDIVRQFKFGESKTIKKDKINSESMLELLQKYGSDKNAKNEELKSFKILDMDGLLKECEIKIKEMNMEDLSFKLKIEAQQEFLGYISLVSGKAEDRPKLYVKEVYQARRKKDNKTFGINILCQSIGSGKQTRYTIFNKTLSKNGQVKVGDIIHCTQWSSSNGYFTIDDYFHVI